MEHDGGAMSGAARQARRARFVPQYDMVSLSTPAAQIKKAMLLNNIFTIGRQIPVSGARVCGPSEPRQRAACRLKGLNITRVKRRPEVFEGDRR